MEDQGEWVLGRKESEGGLSLVRLKDLGPAFAFSDFPERLNVIWDFKSPTPVKPPSPAESGELANFQEALCASVEPSGSAVLCMVFTEPGYREFVFHARTTDDFLAGLNAIARRDVPYPIEIHHDTDADFNLYQSYASALLVRWRSVQSGAAIRAVVMRWLPRSNGLSGSANDLGF